MQRGWTVLECLIALAVIALIVAIVLPVLPSPRSKPNPSATRAFMNSIETACAAYEFDWGAYPSDIVIVNGKTLRSSEALVYFLTTKFRISPGPGEIRADKDIGEYLDARTKHSSDTDGDGAQEIVDACLETYEYDNLRDDPNGFTFYGAKDPRQDKRGRNLQSFDIFTPNSENPGRPLANFKCAWEGN